MSKNIGPNLAGGLGPNKKQASSWSKLAKQRTNSLLSKDEFFAEKPWASTMGTGYSTLKEGQLTLDPSIRSIQEQSLSRNTNLYNELGESGKNILGNLQGLRGRYEGNAAAYTKARVNPMEQELTTRQGELQRNLGLRGVSGSSFGEGAQTNFAIDKERALGDARAQAEMENLQALTGIDAQMASTLFNKTSQQMQINGMDLATAKERLAGELQALGASQVQINTMVKAFEGQQDRAFQERKAIADSILKGFGMG